MLKIRQLQYESDTWKRELIFMMEENVHLKNRLTEVLKYQQDKEIVEDAEIFHDRFIRHDILISILKSDIAELDKLLTKELFDDDEIQNLANTRFKYIRGTMDNAERQFDLLRLEFNNYILGNTWERQE